MWFKNITLLTLPADFDIGLKERPILFSLPQYGENG